MNPISAARRVFVGELGLGGEVRPVRGALCLALAARDAGFDEIVLPAANAAEAAAVDGIRVIPVAHLSEAVGHVAGIRPIAAARATPAPTERHPVPTSPRSADRRSRGEPRRSPRPAGITSS